MKGQRVWNGYWIYWAHTIFGYNSQSSMIYTYVKQYTNQSGLMEYNSGVWLPLPIDILERFETHLGMFLIHLSEGISKHQELNKKFATTALNTMLTSLHTQTT
jgi:hypothetical protein